MSELSKGLIMENLRKALKQLNIMHDQQTIQKFQDYMDKLLEYNKSINLTAITDAKEFVNKHYIDSIKIATSKEFQGVERIIDVGTGGGFPGIPLAIIAPEKEFILIDSLNKRLKIVEEIANEIGINNIKVIHGRAEDLGHDSSLREKFPLAVSRAVAAMPTLAEYCLPFVEVGGSFVAYKGPTAEKELKDGEKAIDILGGKLDRIEMDDQYVEEVGSDNKDSNNHNLIFIKKIKNIPDKYPRKAGTPTKQPL